MEVMCRRYMRIFMLTLLTFGKLTAEMTASKVKQVVFQTNLLPNDDTIQCYGHCNEDIKGNARSFNATRCEGRIIRFGCGGGYNIRIHSTILGKLSPELDICTQQLQDGCAGNFTQYTQRKCNNRARCKMDIAKDSLKSKCGIAGHLSLKIDYFCDLAPTTLPPTSTSTSTSTTTSTTTEKTTTTTTPKAAITSTEGITTKLIPVIQTSRKTTRKTSANKIHLALALVLSMFTGVLVIICVFLAHCIRKKRKKAQQLVESKQTILTSRGEDEELLKSDPADDLRSVRSVATTNSSGYRKSKHSGDGNDNDVYIIDPSECDRRRSTKSPTFYVDEETPLSAFPPPPKELLKTSSSSSGELISPPTEFKGIQKDIPTFTVAAAAPNNVPMDTLVMPKQDNRLDVCGSSICETGELLFDNSNDDTLEGSDFEYVEMGQYHASDEYSSSSQISRSVCSHRTDHHDCHIAPKRRGRSIGDTSQEEAMRRTIESNVFAKKRMKKCNSKDRSFHKSKSFDDSRKKIHVCRGDDILVPRNPRKERMQVMQRYDEGLPRVYSHKVVNSDNEVARRRRQCEFEYKQRGLSSCDVHCRTCKKCGESNLQGYSSTSNCQSSHEEEDDIGHLLVHSPQFRRKNIIMNNRHFIVEESGYQSHDTGTDSMCSSAFSTDQEDNRMFSPVPVSSISRSGCRSKDCRTRNHDPRRDKRLVVVCDRGAINSKVYRRCQCDNHSYVDDHRHDDPMPREIQLYDSSQDTESTRGSLKKTPKARKLKTNSGNNMTSFDEEINKCTCVHVTTSTPQADDVVKVDAMETM